MSLPDRIRSLTSRFLSYRIIAGVEVLGVITLLVPFTIWPVVLLFGWVSLWLRRRTWKDVGARRPRSWAGVFLAAVPLGFGWPLFNAYVAEPWIESAMGQQVNHTLFLGLKENLTAYLVMLGYVWLTAAFGKEMVYRAYLMNRITDTLGNRLIGVLVSLIISSATFAVANAYQGLTGMVEMGYVGIVLGLLYVLGGRNLWLPFIVHGMYDTIGLTLIYLGKYPGLP